MRFEAPVRAAVHAGRSKRGETKLFFTRRNIFCNFFQIGKALDVFRLITRFFQKCLIGDQTIAFCNIGNPRDFVAVFQFICLVGQFTVNRRTRKIIAIIFP